MIITLDGSQIRNEADFHSSLSGCLDLGVGYGKNLAALWDRLSTDIPRPLHIIWENASASKDAMGNDLFERICDLLRDVEKSDKELGFKDRFLFTLRH